MDMLKFLEENKDLFEKSEEANKDIKNDKNFVSIEDILINE